MIGLSLLLIFLGQRFFVSKLPQPAAQIQPPPQQFERGDRALLDRALGEMAPKAKGTLDFRQSNYEAFLDAQGNRHIFVLTAIQTTHSDAYEVWTKELIELNEKRASSLRDQNPRQEVQLRVSEAEPLVIAPNITPPRWWTPTKGVTETCAIHLELRDPASGRSTATHTRLQYSRDYMNIWLYCQEITQ